MYKNHCENVYICHYLYCTQIVSKKTIQGKIKQMVLAVKQQKKSK